MLYDVSVFVLFIIVLGSVSEKSTAALGVR